ncbi:MAG: conjugal transfer protein TraF, partial [Elusimicrobia bacterium]|nr:conjugal transfer protein TraF [Elusimicrobiota bacterium]
MSQGIRFSKRAKEWGIFVLFLLVVPVSHAWASFQSTPKCIKTEAMGGAGVAMPDDACALLINPSGLATLDRAELSMEYGSPIAGLQDLPLNEGHLALGIPIGRRWSVGAGGTFFRAPGLLSEYQAMGGASVLLGPVSIGANLNYLYHNYEIANDPVYANEIVFANGHSKGALGLDIGLTAFVTKNLRLGFSGRNLNKPDVGLASEDPVPPIITLGLGAITRYANFALDFENRNDGLGLTDSNQNTWKVGMEIPLSILFFRAGYN